MYEQTPVQNIGLTYKYKCYNQHTQFYRQSRRMVPDQPQKQPKLQKSGHHSKAQQINLSAEQQVAAFPKVVASDRSPQLQKRAQIKFYSGYSSFSYEASRMGIDHTADSQTQLLVQDCSIKNSAVKIKNQNRDHKHELGSSKGKAMKVEENASPEQRVEALEVESKDVEGQDRFKQQDRGRMGGGLQLNRMSTYFHIVKTKGVMKRPSKGNISIANRKCQAIADTGEIFDEEQLANNMIGPDQCRLWRNMMNKYIIKNKAAKGGRKKGSVKSQFVAKENSLEGKNQESEGNMGNNRNSSVGKEEQDGANRISNQNNQGAASQMCVKKQEEQCSRGEQAVANQFDQEQLGQQYLKQQQGQQGHIERQPKKQGNKIKKSYDNTKKSEAKVLKKRGRKKKQQ